MPIQPSVKAVLFDLDGTIIDSAPDLHAAANNLLTEENRREISLEETIGMIGDGVPKIVERAFRATGYYATDNELKRFVGRFLEFYEPNSTKLTRLFPGCIECLKRLHEQKRYLAVCTNKPFNATSEILNRLDIAKFFTTVIGGDTLPGIKKPNPIHLLSALETIKVSPTNSVMIGDHANDVNAARAAGIPAIICRFGYTNGPAEKLQGDLIIDHFDELPAAFNKLGFNS